MTSDSRVKAVGEIKTVYLFDMVVDLKPQLNIGNGPFGRRILFAAAGGRSKARSCAAKYWRMAVTGRYSAPTER